MPLQDSFKTTYGNRSYYMSISLYNSEGDAIVLTRGAVRFLEITDNILNPFHEGILILTNDFNVLESGTVPYTFLGNGTDYISIKIITENTQSDFNIELFCVVTECSDIKYGNSLCKQLSFVEERQYLLNERFWNPLESKQATSGSYVDTNTGNAQPTGDLIKSILTTVCNSNDIFGDVFDAEDCPKLNLAPCGTVSYDKVLDYVLLAHSHQKSPCYIEMDRQTKRFNLVSFKRIFQEHPNYVTERLVVADPRADSNTGPNIDFNAVPIAYGPVDSDGLSSGKDSVISEMYTESPAAIHGVDFFANQSVTGYSRSNGTFLYDLQTLSKNEFIDTYNNLFIQPFAKLMSKYDIVQNFYPKKTSSSANWTNENTAVPSAVFANFTLNRKLLALLFMNQVYTFKLPGITRRHAGDFVDVYKASLRPGEQPSNWDCNTLGRHLITTVKHIFTDNTYTNSIETIKPYRVVNNSDTTNGIDFFLK